MEQLYSVPEPNLVFGFDQKLEDPRDGLTLFGPFEKGSADSIRAGVIGTAKGISFFISWVDSLNHPIYSEPSSVARPPFPGFEAVFKIRWNSQPLIKVVLDEKDIKQKILLEDGHRRVFETVSLFEDGICNARESEDANVDIWFVIIPDDLYKYCRPKSTVETYLKLKPEKTGMGMNYKIAQTLKAQYSIFNEDEQSAQPYYYDVHFHNQLKARLLKREICTQVLKESTLAYKEIKKPNGQYLRDLSKMQSAIAWNIATTAYYKVGGKPWKIADIRKGVCYIGLVYKHNEKAVDPCESCCAAQMFLDSGDGLVFKGAIGPWKTPDKNEYHLSPEAAGKLIQMALDSYKSLQGGYPKELFIHGKVRFSDSEWEGFKSKVPQGTNLVGIKIQEARNIKLYRKSKHPVLRGLSYAENESLAYLWTRGFVPRLQTYPGREVPNPLLIEICKGNATMSQVLADILTLTKVNYNTCLFADGVPVTLKFADAIGEVLTAGPLGDIRPLPFKFYI